MNSNKRIPPSKRVRQEMEEIVAGMEAGEGERDIIGELMKNASKMIIQELLEKEVEEYLGRKYYQRDKEVPEERGYRNGYEENTIKAEVPQVRDGKEKYCSRIKEFYKRNTEVLEKLAVEMYSRGLSEREIEEALYTATGDRLLSRSNVSKVTEILWEEYVRGIHRQKRGPNGRACGYVLEFS